MGEPVFPHQLLTLCAFARARATLKRSHVSDMHSKHGASLSTVATVVSKAQVSFTGTWGGLFTSWELLWGPWAQMEGEAQSWSLRS
jgi:hypothetical protein